MNGCNNSSFLILFPFCISNSVESLQIWWLTMDSTCTWNTARHPKLSQDFHKCLQNPTLFLLLWWPARVTCQTPPYWASLWICWGGCKCPTFFWASMLQHHTAFSITAQGLTTVLRLNSRENGRESECCGYMWPFFSLKEHLSLKKLFSQMMHI